MTSEDRFKDLSDLDYLGDIQNRNTEGIHRINLTVSRMEVSRRELKIMADSDQQEHATSTRNQQHDVQGSRLTVMSNEAEQKRSMEGKGGGSTKG